ncbi:B-cell lymphoma 3 protein [Rhinophrynus dorsalis]
MDHPHRTLTGGVETSSPLDLSTRKNMDMFRVAPRSPQGFRSWGALKVSEPLKEVKLEKTDPPKEIQNESIEGIGLCKDQACLPLRKRKYPPSHVQEGPLLKLEDKSPEWTRKFLSPSMTVTLPPYYPGSASAYLPSSLLPLYPASSPALLNVPHLGILHPQHTTLLYTDAQLQADINAATQPDEDGDTALHIAVVHGNISAAQRVISLLRHGRGHLDALNNLRQTPLHLAVITDQPALVSLLLAHGSSPQIPDRNGQTCVHLACEYGSESSLEVLLRGRTWDLEATNYQGMTALHVAISTGRRDITLCLLENGADVDSVDVKSGNSPLIQAVESGSEDLVSLLLQHGAQVNAQTYAGNTALHVASGRGLAEITRILLRSGADCSTKNCHNDTAMTVAKDRMIIDILRGKSSSPRAQNEKCRGEIGGCAFTPPQGGTPGYNSASPSS